jgi:adenosylcobinamide kinase/adenosylcobinamide-phosphate guanylyltransferase
VALVLFTGGARSGKSSAAQALAHERRLDGGDVCVAVFGRESDPEMIGRIDRHRSERPEAFMTIEARDSSTWLGEVDDEALLLVDCLGTLLGLVMEEEWKRVGGVLNESPETDELPPELEPAVSAAFGQLIDRIVARLGDTIVVTNEVGDGVVPSWPSGRLFRDELGRANRLLTAAADKAYLCVCGRLIDLTCLPTRAGWPVD